MVRHVSATALVLSLVLSSCGGGTASTPPGGGGESTGPAGGGGGQAGSQSDLEAAARAQFEAFVDDDDSAYFASLSAACRANAGFGAVSERNNSRHARINRAGMDLSAIRVTEVKVTDFEGSTADVALVLDGTDGNEFLEAQKNPWVFEDGAWHWANCDPFETGGGGGGVGGSGPDDPIGVGFIATIADWLVYSTYIQPDGDSLVMEGGNPAPPAGTQYFLWQISVTYNGPSASVKLADDLSFRFAAGGTTYDSATDCGAHPGSLDMAMVAAPGDSQMGTICHEIATGDVGSLQLVAKEKATGTDFWFGQQ